MRIHFLQHVPFETPGLILDWCEQRHVEHGFTRLYEPDPHFPVLETLDALVVMGGPMGVHDTRRFPWLATEMVYIHAAIEAGKPVLGVCLGAQLIAACLGADVSRNPHREIGWFPVDVSEEGTAHPLLTGVDRRLNVFHWHGDRFAIPDGAVRSFSSEGCDNQGFFVGKQVIGLQFHLEMTPSGMKDLIEACGDELKESSPWIQAAETMQQSAAFTACRKALFTLLDNWLRR